MFSGKTHTVSAQGPPEDAGGEAGGPGHPRGRGREQGHREREPRDGLLCQRQEATCHVPQGFQLQSPAVNIA